MKFSVATKVNQEAIEVWNGFDKELFLKLSPPFPKVRLIQFDGSSKGDTVGLELNFVLFRQKWISDITENEENEKEIYFIDQGRTLPFFLSRWKHVHRILKKSKGSVILDEINFSTGFILTDILFFPLLYLQFIYRKPIYKREFS